MLLCVFLVWPTKFANTLSFYTKQIWCLRIYGECLKILILGKLGLKFVFLKNFAPHTRVFYSYFSMLGGVYAQNWAVFQNCVFFSILIDLGCFSINRNCFKNFKGAAICFYQSKIVNKVFFKKKLRFDLFIYFFKTFSNFPLSLSNLARLHWGFFVIFNQIFARFFSHKAGKTFIPFILFLFSWFHA